MSILWSSVFPGDALAGPGFLLVVPQYELEPQWNSKVGDIPETADWERGIMRGDGEGLQGSSGAAWGRGCCGSVTAAHMVLFHTLQKTPFLLLGFCLSVWKGKDLLVAVDFRFCLQPEGPFPGTSAQ